ncbi:hypothetical protein SDC9_18346 [bioreactor metagenome]|uniref:Archaeal Type IV pilin N-terminal domain-containing protein n=1 Tax=bioreactor metagenome TaxID=1076179 RepID=A0A644U3H0_9ZZZZ|nr:type IV pilin [Methanocorpusculum sp.]
MKDESGVSSVVGVVLLLLLVVLAASVIGITLSTATQNAAESTPNVIFAPSANPQMLYHSGGDILYKNRLIFYVNGVDITGLTQINGDDAWTEWRTGQAITLPGNNFVTNLTIIALDNLGRDQMLYRGSGVVVTPVPTPIPTTSTPTVTPTTPTPTPTTPTPTPTPTPSPYYVVGSEYYANASAFIQSVNDWQAGTFVYENEYHHTGRPILKKDIIVGNEPIVITSELIGSSGVFEIAGSQTGNIPVISRAPGYDGALLVIEENGLQISYGAITFDGMGHGNEPIIIVGEGTTFYAADYFTVKNGMNEDGVGVEGGGMYIAGTVSFHGSTSIAGNSAKYGGGIFIDTGGSLTMSGGSITGNYATVKGGGVYNNGAHQLNSGTIDETNTAPIGSVYYAVAGSTNNRAIFMRFAPGQQKTTPTVDQAVNLYLPYWG